MCQYAAWERVCLNFSFRFYHLSLSHISNPHFLIPFFVPRIHFQKNGIVYDGEFERGVPHGIGTLSTEWGVKYVGEWSGGVMHGRGVLHDGRGQIYDGQFQGGLK